MHYSICCIFTHFGRTFTFKDVAIVCRNESILQFSYRAMSDDLRKVATFPIANIAGYSLTEMIKEPLR